MNESEKKTESTIGARIVNGKPPDGIFASRSEERRLRASMSAERFGGEVGKRLQAAANRLRSSSSPNDQQIAGNHKGQSTGSDPQKSPTSKTESTSTTTAPTFPANRLTIGEIRRIARVPLPTFHISNPSSRYPWGGVGIDDEEERARRIAGRGNRKPSLSDYEGE